ncbi:MAG: hypothetical protein WD403_11605, partial [Pirellulales bacterium]
DTDVARDALEELAKSRDPDAIEWLFYLIRHPPPRETARYIRADELLSRIGDRNGDVYDPAMKQGALGIAARVDSPRALADCKRLLPQASATERNAIAAALGYIPDKESVRLALELLADAKATEGLPPALISLRKLFVENSAPNLFSEETRAMLCEQGLPLVKQALVAGRFPANYEGEALYWVGDPPTVDLTAFREMLLNSSDRIDQGVMDLELIKAIQQAQRATDPRVIPILLETLKEVPEARGQHAFAIQEAILFYAHVCRNAVRKEYLRLGLDRSIDPQHRDTPYQLRNLFKALGIDRPQPERSKLPSEAASTDELLAAVRASAEKAEDGNRARAIARLLEGDDPRAFEAYLSYLDDARRLVPDRFRNGKRLSSDYVELLHRLLPGHCAEFFERVQSLLGSELQAERHVGVQALKSALGSRLGLDSEDVEAVRREKLNRIEPVLARLARMTQEEIRRHLLEQHGFRLEGPKGEAWLPVLRSAASSCHWGVSRNALILIRQILGEPDVIHLLHLPHGQRRRAIELLLDDRAHP